MTEKDTINTIFWQSELYEFTEIHNGYLLFNLSLDNLLLPECVIRILTGNILSSFAANVNQNTILFCKLNHNSFKINKKVLGLLIASS